jgi:hypothetical protein
MLMAKYFAIVLTLLRCYSEAEADDAVELAQRFLRVHGAEEADAASGPAANGSTLDDATFDDADSARPAEGLPTLAGAPNCKEYPVLCSEKLRCDKDTPKEDITPRIATVDGHANPRAWCYKWTWHHLNSIVEECLSHRDITASAQDLFQKHKRIGQAELMGSYCFYEKHCSNSKVTIDTTVEQAEKMCDARYGHSKWASFGVQNWGMQRWWRLSGKMNNTDGFHSRIPTQSLAKMFCAMGNYHCNVMYCKETYCKDPEYIQKYGHLLKEEPLPGDP